MMFCNTGCNSRCRNRREEEETKCVCECECPPEREEEKPQMVRALLNTVLDSCCTTEDFCREIKVCCPDVFDPDELEIGSVIDIELADDITFKEVKRSKDDCVCVSTVRFNVPVRIFGVDGRGCCKRSIVRNLTIIRSATLCCTRDSILNTFNSRVLAASAVVSEICGHEVTITISLLFRACLQQTLVREFKWEATPVCINPNCNDSRNSFVDPCDTICGCSSNSKTCPTC